MAKKKMPPTKSQPKKKAAKKQKQKKSTKEKSLTKSEDDGKTLITLPNKSATVDQTTNYFTVNQSFDHSTQKI
uniref:Uncharacterized protein n=1 Tax=Panagrolaimus davidi TaxID=227884 RepID=A0A914Q5S7_9BILA